MKAVKVHGHPLLGLLPALREDPLAVLDDLAATDDLVRFRVAHLRCMTVNHPDAIHRVMIQNKENYAKSPLFDRLDILLGRGLVMTTGEEWAWDRRQLQPAFTRASIRQRYEAVADRVRSTADRWLAREGQALDLSHEMLRLSLEILVDTLVPGVGEADMLQMLEAFEAMQRELHTRLWETVPLPLALPTARNRAWARHRAVIDGIIERVLRDPEPGSLVDTVARAQPAPGREREAASKVVDQLATFFFAGHETTGNSLAFLWHHLMAQPAVLERVRDELDAVCGEADPTVDDLRHLPWCLQVLNEALRVHPTVWAYTRLSLGPDTVCGRQLPANTTLFVSPWTLHRHPRYWARPHVFDPEHFSPDAVAERPRYAFIPFGAGRRACIGDHFAMLELFATLTVLARRVELRPTGAGPLRPVARLTVTPEGGVPATVHARKQPALKRAAP